MEAWVGKSLPLQTAPFSLYSPVALPGMADVRVMDAMLVRLLIEEVEHVLDGQGQSRATVGCAEDGLEQVIHKLLQCALGMGDTVRSSPASCLGDRAGEVMTSGDTVHQISPPFGNCTFSLCTDNRQKTDARAQTTFPCQLQNLAAHLCR